MNTKPYIPTTLGDLLRTMRKDCLNESAPEFIRRIPFVVRSRTVYDWESGKQKLSKSVTLELWESILGENRISNSLKQRFLDLTKISVQWENADLNDIGDIPRHDVISQLVNRFPFCIRDQKALLVFGPPDSGKKTGAEQSLRKYRLTQNLGEIIYFEDNITLPPRLVLQGWLDQRISDPSDKIVVYALYNAVRPDVVNNFTRNLRGNELWIVTSHRPYLLDHLRQCEIYDLPLLTADQLQTYAIRHLKPRVPNELFYELMWQSGRLPVMLSPIAKYLNRNVKSIADGRVNLSGLIPLNLDNTVERIFMDLPDEMKERLIEIGALPTFKTYHTDVFKFLWDVDESTAENYLEYIEATSAFVQPSSQDEDGSWEIPWGFKRYIDRRFRKLALDVQQDAIAWEERARAAYQENQYPIWLAKTLKEYTTFRTLKERWGIYPKIIPNFRMWVWWSQLVAHVNPSYNGYTEHIKKFTKHLDSRTYIYSLCVAHAQKKNNIFQGGLFKVMLGVLVLATIVLFISPLSPFNYLLYGYYFLLWYGTSAFAGLAYVIHTDKAWLRIWLIIFPGGVNDPKLMAN